MAPPLHPSLAPIAFLLGEWEGLGEGRYPTIDDFSYGEHLTFGHAGKPFLSYAQRSWDPATGAPMHVETGYLRVTEAAVGQPGAGVEMVVSQPTGIVEVLVGTVVDDALRLHSTVVALTPTAKEVVEVERELRLQDGVLVGRLAMAAVGRPLTHHLASRLARPPA
ncbi:FABP family protein [Rhabdothermincola salaria]|uniref:FABP family protein n=1 Tax=Rhabdothermincola salaria TaxID=2903142 RepID=UPI001E3AE5A7|nr:FABP family protein [Rhabdothermincola salaria]MCD9624731.1 FABP family protein [Rhabdothermincola salaria]